MKNKYVSITVRFLCLTLCGILSLVWTTNTMAQCVEVGYKNASQNPRYVTNGWDTVVSCDQPSVILIPDYTVTAMTPNGQYRVDTIPYNPPDTTFYSTSGVGGGQILVMDDEWHTPMPLPFPFNFFGTNYDSIQVGGNGIVSFQTNYATNSNNMCAFNYSVYCPIPNPAFPHKNAIYGVYEDIDPAATSHLPDAQSAHRGIFQSIYDDYPCRKLCVSYNGMQQYGMPGNYCTYQIVCYEGTNIIEVHVKKRSQGSATNNGCGLIGIQNATGTAAYVAKPSTAPDTAYNPFGKDVEFYNEAFRFTPLGDTVINFTWYRGTEVNEVNRIRSGGDDPGNDTLILMKDTLNQGTDHAVEVNGSLDVRNITTPQYITVRMRFISASVDSTGNNIAYDQTYTYHIGVDNTNTLLYDTICQGSDYAAHGFSASNVQESDTLEQTFAAANGCDSTVTLYLTVMPTYTIVIEDSVARGGSYTRQGFDLSDLQESDTYTQTLASKYGCDSIVTLHLTVQEVGIETVEKGDAFAMVLYPNPADESVTLHVEALPCEAEVSLCNAQGRRVLMQTLQAGQEMLTLNIGQLAAGSYHLRIASKDIVVLRKLIVR